MRARRPLDAGGPPRRLSARARRMRGTHSARRRRRRTLQTRALRPPPLPRGPRGRRLGACRRPGSLARAPLNDAVQCPSGGGPFLPGCRRAGPRRTPGRMRPLAECSTSHGIPAGAVEGLGGGAAASCPRPGGTAAPATARFAAARLAPLRPAGGRPASSPLPLPPGRPPWHHHAAADDDDAFDPFANAARPPGRPVHWRVGARRMNQGACGLPHCRTFCQIKRLWPQNSKKFGYLQ